jgi:hypothetical protein
MVFENVGGVDENNHRLSGNPTTELSNVKTSTCNVIVTL